MTESSHISGDRQFPYTNRERTKLVLSKDVFESITRWIRPSWSVRFYSEAVLRKIKTYKESSMVVSQKHQQQFKRLAIRAVCLLWVVISTWGIAFVPQASADSIGVGSKKAAAIVRDRAANELDRMAGAGALDLVEGSAEGSVGDIKRSLGQMTNDLNMSLDGATDQLRGKVKRDVGRLKSQAADISSDLENAAEDAVDSVSDLFD